MTSETAPSPATPKQQIAQTLKDWKYKLQDDILPEAVRRFFYLFTWPVAIFPDAADCVICALLNRREFTPELFTAAFWWGLSVNGTKSGRVQWISPNPHGILPLEELHMPKLMKRYIKSGKFTITFDHAYGDVIRHCADREKTWITPKVIEVYEQLHEMGIAHSVEAWKDGELVGGGIGQAMGDIFAMESMFYTVSQASKVAFAQLALQLKEAGFTTIDSQVVSHHLVQFGLYGIPRKEYRARLGKSLEKLLSNKTGASPVFPSGWSSAPEDIPPRSVAAD